MPGTTLSPSSAWRTRMHAGKWRAQHGIAEYDFRHVQRRLGAFDVRRRQIDIAFRHLFKRLIARQRGGRLFLGGQREIAGLHRSGLPQPKRLLARRIDGFFRKVGLVVADGLSCCGDRLLDGGDWRDWTSSAASAMTNLLAVIGIVHAGQQGSGLDGRAFVEWQQHDAGLDGLEAQKALMSLDIARHQQRVGRLRRTKPAGQRAAAQDKDQRPHH